MWKVFPSLAAHSGYCVLEEMITKFFSIKKNSNGSQFTAVSAIPRELKEKVFLNASDFSKPIDVSENHIPLCLNPLLIGIISKDSNEFEKNKKIELSVVSSNSLTNKSILPNTTLLAKIYLKYFDSVELGKSIRVILFKVIKSGLFQASKADRLRFTMLLYLHYLKIGKRNSISFLNSLAALYSFPRKVVLNIIKTDSHFNIFPMDLICELFGDDLILLGLNINNRSIEEIIRTKNMLIVEPDATSKNIVYGFAGNHNKEMIESDFSDKYKIESETFHFPIPDFSCSYKEITCIKHVKLGSHYLLVCRVLNKKILKPQVPLLYHITTIQQLHLEKQNISYVTA